MRIFEKYSVKVGDGYNHRYNLSDGSLLKDNRVDKSHSKETGGTGLGLSIVKHAVAYHGGKIKLESTVNVGTTITVCFDN